VARELGLSDRTLQRRIIDDGATFRQLLLEVRQELAHEYLNRPEMDVTEVAFLLGYEDSNSFYRAFRTWEGTTPSQLRAALRRSRFASPPKPRKRGQPRAHSGGREPFDRHGVCHGITGHALLRAAASRRRVNGVMISPAPRSRG